MFNKLTLVIALILFAGCSSGASSSGTSTTVSAIDSTVALDETTTVPAVPVAATTTVAATAPPAPPTTVAIELVLREDGLGPFDFGTAPGPVVDALTAQFGAPASDSTVTYESPSGGYFTDLDGSGYSLGHPVGRTICWAGDFCAELGGASDAALIFEGWTYSGTPHMLASSSNLTIGAKWADFPSMTVYPTCYVDGGGTHSGINLVLDVAGGWEWLVSDGAGGYVPNLPDPEATRVTFMNAGFLPFLEGLDC